MSAPNPEISCWLRPRVKSDAASNLDVLDRGRSMTIVKFGFAGRLHRLDRDPIHEATPQIRKGR
jgi:hypothetical protein